MTFLQSKNSLFFLVVCVVLPSLIFAQATQTIRGTVSDREAKYALAGATVSLIDDPAQPIAVATDENGAFRVEKVVVGRHTLKVSFLGYKDILMENIIVNSGKETILNLELEESVLQQNAVIITDKKQYGDTRNEMATVSSRSFSIEETDRYAGSRGDPARMASNFAGVQGADDSRNDIVIRGNSPGGVVWRLEGVDLFNPNHFNIPGTAGGSITILNNKWLSNSDFFTGAFPAEYGNSVAGVFDLKMRNGNNEKLEGSAQLGLLGLEAMVEAPLAKNSKASFLASYRYSTLSILGNFGIKLGTNAVPRYQDAAFRLNFPLKNKANLAIFGVGGTSAIDILISNQKEKTKETDLYGSNDRDQYFHTRMGFVGAAYSKTFSTNTYLKATLMLAGEQAGAEHNLIFRRLDATDNKTYIYDSLPKNLRYDFRQTKLSFAPFVNHKINKKTTLKAGLNFDAFLFNFHDTIRNTEDRANPDFKNFSVRWNADRTTFLVQPYAQVKYNITEKITINGGIHAQYFSQGNALSAVEPRLGVKFELPNAQLITVGTGLHSQIQNSYLYFYQNKVRTDPTDRTEYNRNMGFTKSLHTVVGYQKIIGKRTLLKAETYYQYLYDIPVEKNRASSFSLVNTGSGFSRFFANELENKGTGENYGVELTLEKGFSNHYYYMFTGSLFEATYKGSNGVKHNTDFNGKYAFNGLFAYEFVINKRQTLNVGTKVTFAGGRWYGNIDSVASAVAKEAVYKDDDKFNTYQFRPYFRTDLKINYKINASKITHEIGLDLVNLFDTQNTLRYSWVPLASDITKGTTREEYQLGRLPIFYYKIDF